MERIVDENMRLRQDRRFTESDIDELPVPYEPFLPAIRKGFEYTLVLDLDETLIHYDIDDQANEGFYLIRPAALKFLYDMSLLFEIVVFTAAIPDYANWIIDQIDPDGLITHRLYRQHTTPKEDCALKDINKLGRSMKKTIIVDNIEENFKECTPYNGIRVQSWFDEMDDCVMENLGPFLAKIVERKVEDVRTLLKNFKPTVERCLDEGRRIPEFSPLDLIDL